MSYSDSDKFSPDVYQKLTEIEIKVGQIELNLQREREVKVFTDYDFESICQFTSQSSVSSNPNFCLKETKESFIMSPEGSKLPISGVFSYESISGVSYVGEWKDNKIHGKGFLEDRNGNTYIGEFVEGKLHGNVLLKYFDGSAFQGKFVNNKKHGPGKMTFANDHYLVVNWLNDLPDGWGKLYDDQDNLVFQGNYKNGLKNGIGFEIIQDTQDKYFGEYQNDRFHGVGKYLFASGNFYVGEVEHGMKHGLGKFVGSQFYAVSRFEYDREIGLSEVFWDDGSKFFGRFKKNCFLEGLLDLKHSVFKGSWVDGKGGELIKRSGWY